MRKIAIVIFPNVNLLDVAGPAQVFTTAREQLVEAGEGEGYSVELFSVSGGLIPTTSGLELNSRPLAAMTDGIDTLLISGGHGAEAAGADTILVAWLNAIRPKIRRLGSICTGAFVLAGAGLLEGKRAATHWAYCDRLQADYPDIEVERDAIFVQDGGIWTSAGITSGMDLALAMLEEDHGRELALLVSRRLVIYLKRSGGQSQFSVPLQAQAAEGPLADLLKWIAQNPGADLRVEQLAARAGVTERTLHRMFLMDLGHTPARWVERARLETARRLLESTSEQLQQVAVKVGFGSADRMRRTFLRELGIGPSTYRERFHRDHPASSPHLQAYLHEHPQAQPLDR